MAQSVCVQEPVNTDLNYYVDLKSDFARPKIVNGLPVEPLGAELARFLAKHLTDFGFDVLAVDESDEGSYVKCHSNASIIELMVTFDYWDVDDERWSIMVCRRRTFWRRSDFPAADIRSLLFAIESILRDSNRFTDIRWFPGFETSEYLSLMRPSSGPVRNPDLDEDLPFALRFDRFSARFANVVLPSIFIVGMLGLVLFGRAIPRLASIFGGVCLAVFVLAAFIFPITAGRLIHCAAGKGRKPDES